MNRSRVLPGHRPSGFFVLRTPLLPAAVHRRIGEGLHAAVASAAAANVGERDLTAAIERDRAIARGRLREVFEDPALRAALAMASPATEAAIEGWSRDPHDRRGRKAERALMRYVTRAADRPTPFGLFAGVTTGELGERTALVLPGRDGYVAATRISSAWATELASRLGERHDLRDELVYRPSTSLYRLPGRTRWVAWREQDEQRIHSIRQLRDGPALALVLDHASDGATTGQLAERLVAEGRGDENRAMAFVRRLVGEGLLVCELAPPVTGGAEPDRVLLAGLEAIPAAAGVAAALRDAGRAVRELDREGFAAAPHRWRAVRAQLRHLDGIELRVPPLAVELHKPAPGLTIGPALTDELLRGVDVLRHWQPLAGDDPLHAFRAAFQRRYGEREVPLTEALDEDAGVGAGVLRERPARPPVDERRERLLLAKVEDTLRRRAGDIVVERGELEREPVALPPSFVVGARVAAASAAAVDRGDFRVWLKSARGPDAMGMFTRFCRGNDPLRDHVCAHMRSEEALDPDAVHAEIAHLPQLELGPVLHRPLLRSVEIDYLGPSGAPRERRLQLSDLLVSVAGESVLLRSRHDGRWVVPRLGTALNIDLNLPPAFRLLVLVERQEGIHIGWSWGALRDAPYQPRVRSGRTILAPAHWRLDGDDVAVLGHGSDAERFRAVARLRQAHRLPRHVAVTDEDNILPVDLDSTVGVDLLLGLARGREAVDLTEVHPDPSQLVVEGPEGRFAHELIVPFLGRAPRRRAPAPASARGGTAAGGGAADAAHRSFPPGSGWLYLKIYSGAGAADEILRRGVAPLCERLAADGGLTRWFFIRYADPDPHLRVRLQVERPERRGDALAQIGELGDALLERRLAWRTTLDTYEREVERYGGPAGTDLCERWFAADSEAAVALLGAAHERGASTDARWRAALLAVDAALDAFGLGDAARHDAMRAAREHRARLLEEAAGVTDARSFARRYAHRHRREHDALQHALAQARDGAPDVLLAPYAERAERFRAIAAELHAAHDAGALTRPPLDICLSLVHMRINRLVALATPEPEVRLYDALERLYASQLARARHSARHPIA